VVVVDDGIVVVVVDDGTVVVVVVDETAVVVVVVGDPGGKGTVTPTPTPAPGRLHAPIATASADASEYPISLLRKAGVPAWLSLPPIVCSIPPSGGSEGHKLQRGIRPLV
jgi:hypothetical protein